jgi:hypothetical protein
VDTIKEIYVVMDKNNVQAVSTEIDNSIQAIMMDLGNKLTPELSQEVASVYNLNAKFAFYNVCFSKVHDILHMVDPKLASVFNNIQETNVSVVSKFTEKLLALHPTIAELIQRLEEVENEKRGSTAGRKSHKSGAAGPDAEELQKEVALLREENKLSQEKLSRQAREIDRLKREANVTTLATQGKSKKKSLATDVTGDNEMRLKR